MDETVVELVAKSCPVKEVHVPQRPPQHLFLIVVLACGVEEAQGFVRNFNHSFWKGRKLRVELAKEFYLDRLKNEWSQPCTDASQTLNQYFTSLPAFNATTLRIKKRKREPPMLITFRDSLPPEDVTSATETHSEAEKKEKDSSIGELRVDKALHYDEARTKENETTELRLTSTQPGGAKSNLEGGGKRRGFGTLLKEPSKDLEVTLERKKQWTYDLDLAQSLDDPEGGRPCLSAEDVAEETLQQERQRIMGILSSLQNRISAEESKELPVIDFSETPQDSAIAGMRYNTGVANVTSLKSMFHREGGVWFGDDGTLEETVVKGSVDSLFLEAERLGIDIRKDDRKEDSQMMFSFFGDPVQSEHQEQEKQKAPSVSAINKDSGSVAAQQLDFVGTDAQIPSIPTLLEIVELAKLFRPTKYAVFASCGALLTLFIRSISEIERDWKNHRERLALEYKRKRKDVRS